MKLYESTDLPIRNDLREAHGQVWRELGEPGTWWTGAERVAIASEARRARIEAGLAEGDFSSAASAVELPPVVREVAASVGATPETLRREWFAERVPTQIDEGAYVEAIGVIAKSVCIDTFCRGAGLPLTDFPVPIAGAPSRATPSALARDVGWVSMIPEGCEEGDDLYGGATVNVVRALSRVPEEVRAWMRVAGTQYVHVDIIGDMAAPYDRAIDRTQIELVAGRVSALNECFY